NRLFLRDKNLFSREYLGWISELVSLLPPPPTPCRYSSNVYHATVASSNPPGGAEVPASPVAGSDASVGEGGGQSVEGEDAEGRVGGGDVGEG
ncbi:unnamed protein product, partial [Choristocarpus tenellus]